MIRNDTLTTSHPSSAYSGSLKTGYARARVGSRARDIYTYI